MDRIERLVRDKLRELRRQHYPNMHDFEIHSRIYNANARRIEAPGSKTLPSFRNLYRWITACGMTLSEFFTQIEAKLNGKRAAPEPHAVIGAVKILAVRDPLTADALLKLVEGLLASAGSESRRTPSRWP